MEAPKYPYPYTTVTVNGTQYDVSPQHEELFTEYHWIKTKYGHLTTIIDGKRVRFHRFILRATENSPGILRADGNKFNLCLENLRFGTQSEILQAYVKKTKSGCAYLGVTRVTIGGVIMYRAFVKHNHKHVNLGVHKTEVGAATARDQYIAHNSDLVLPLNFPERKEEYLSDANYTPYASKHAKISKYKGVYFEGGMWQAKLWNVNGKKTQRIGKYDTEIDAAKAIDSYIVLHRLHHTLNFSDDYPGYSNKKIKTECRDHDGDPSVVRLVLNSAPHIVVLIDKEDYDKVKHYSCALSACKAYVTIRINGRRQNLSRYLLGVTDSQLCVDHICSDMNGLDNRKANLRISNVVLNSQNKKKQKTPASSKYVGVTYSKAKGKYKSQVKTEYLGYYVTEEDAVRARDFYIMQKYPDSHFRIQMEWTDNDILEWKNKTDVGDSTRLGNSKKRERPN
jgi:hypothetical protein